MADDGSCFKFSVLLFVMKALMLGAVHAETAKVVAVLPTRIESNRDDAGTLFVYVDSKETIRLIGTNFSESTEISFTTESEGSTCDDSKKTESFPVSDPSGLSSTSALFDVTLGDLDPDEEYYFLCVKEEYRTSRNQSHSRWIRQGNEAWVRLKVQPKPQKEYLLPLWILITLLTILLCLSGLFSGLNLGLMALDKTELKIIEKCGSPIEKKYAKVIVPLRKRGNFLLCTLLLGNVLVNSTLTILMDDLSNGLVAVVSSTMAIVVFGEIVPQAICSRHGLAIGAKTRFITMFFMIVTFPLSFPISLLLDKVLGEEIGQVYDKEKLQELIRMTADHKVIQNEEANIIAGALQLSNKFVDDVMTKIEDVYMLDVNTILDFEMMSEIMNHGYTRIPVYDGDKSHIVNLLNTKDLTLIDPDDNTPLGTVCRFYDHRPLFVDSGIKLDSMLQDFLQGNSHMAIVQVLHNDGDVDPWYQIVGVVTLEDVIEEIIQSEIIDETDIMTDNRRKKPRRREKQDYSVFAGTDDDNYSKLSPQLALAAFQYLWTTVEPFSEEFLTRNVLKRLLQQNIMVNLTPTEDTPEDNKNFIYKVGVEVDHFILILQGHADVYVGKENLVFEAGPFSFFGTGALNVAEGQLTPTSGTQESLDYKKQPYIPDFTVRAKTTVQYLRIRRSHYLAARRTSMLLRKQKEQSKDEEEIHFKKEWHKALNFTMSRNNSSNNIVGEILDKQEEKRRSIEALQNKVMGSVEGLHNKILPPQGSPAKENAKPEEKQDKKLSKSMLEDWADKGSKKDLKLDDIEPREVTDTVKEEATLDCDGDEEKTPLVGMSDRKSSPHTPVL